MITLPAFPNELEGVPPCTYAMIQMTMPYFPLLSSTDPRNHQFFDVRCQWYIYESQMPTKSCNTLYVPEFLGRWEFFGRSVVILITIMQFCAPTRYLQLVRVKWPSSSRAGVRVESTISILLACRLRANPTWAPLSPLLLIIHSHTLTLHTLFRSSHEYSHIQAFEGIYIY